MKKLFILSLCLFAFSLSQQTIQAGGYKTYQSVEPVNDGFKIIEKWHDYDFNKYYKKMSKRRLFWGWKTFIAYEDEEVTFLKETLYVIVNQGDTAIEESLKFSSEETVKKHYSATGSLELNGNGTVKGFKLGLEQAIGTEQSLTVTSSLQEAYAIKVLVDPDTKLMVTIKGEGKVTNGVAKYYRFWRVVKKGGWEMFTVTTEYYCIEKVRL